MEHHWFWLAVTLGSALRLMGDSALLACGPLVLEDRVDVVHFAQPLKERDEV